MTDPAEAAKFSEMKSIQLYSTKDEYIYAMKEDLSEWFNAMYSVQLTALNFTDKLENGVVICQHANNVTKAALKTLKFDQIDQNDLNRAGVINIPSCAIQTRSSTNRLLLTPSGKSNWSGDYLLFKADARAQSFQSRDNISNFIKWCRHIAKVRECLMFETDDLILRKNEKNFILCLLEVARFGSKFGIQVPTIIQLEQEIEAEIEREIEQSKSIEPVLAKAISDQAEQIVTTDLNNILDKDDNFTNDRSSSIHSVDLKEKTNSKCNLDNSSLDGSFGVDDEPSTNESGKDMFNDSLEENLDLMDKQNKNDQNELESYQSVNSEAEQPSAFPSSCSSTSLSSNSSIFQQNENFQNICSHALANQAADQKKNRVARNLAPLFRNQPQHKPNSNNGLVANSAKSTNALNKSINKESMDRILFETIQKMNRHHHSLSHNNANHELNLGASQTNLHNHVCSIADRCTCEKQFPVIKIGEGKYRIGNTKNIVFIRILRNHIMVRVGGGWDTLENYLNKHDPCRCSGDPNHSNIGFKSKQSDNIYLNELSNCSSNIVLTPVQNSSINQTNLSNKAQSSVCQNTVQKSQAKANFLSKKSCASANCSTSKKELDFTDAKLVVERNTQGKHVVGKIIINQTNEPSNSSTLNKSLSNSSLNNCCLTNLKVLNDSANSDMNGHAANFIAPLVHNQLLDKNNSFNVYNVNGCRTMAKSGIPTSNSLNSINHNVSKNRMKLFFNQMPPKSPKNAHTKLKKNLLCEHQSTIAKLTSNELSSNPTTTGYNSLNDDSSSDFLEQAPIYTDHRIKSRIVKRYDKKRANTEVIIDLEQMNQSVQQSSVDAALNAHKAANATLKITSSPKPPPRNKKKYRKSKTSDVVAQFDVGKQNSPLEASLNQQEDSLEESDYEFSEGAQSKKNAEKLNDSLESINLTLHNDIKVEDDSLLFNNDHGISLSLSTTSSISNINECELDHEQDILHLGQKNGRAQWDKTAQKLEFKTQLASPNAAFLAQHCHSSPAGDIKQNKAHNLDSVKEQLYQMKQTIDAKINLKQFESGKTPSPAVRTTPRKVKKRSGERSITTGIFKEADPAKKTPPHQSSAAVMAKLCAKMNQAAISKQAWSSLHNLNNCLNSDNSRRTRRDSSVSSNHTCLSNTNLSFSSPNTTPREFKENKAYELRKKSTLLNKIVVKNHHDPIYSRSHPISAQMAQQQALNATLNDHMQSVSSETATSARKRLFAKKSEKQFDANLSIGSNGSSSFSSNSIPVGTNFILRNKILASSPIVNRLKVASPSTNVNKKKCSPVKAKPPPRSRSNNDLFYELERTNSAQDLIELINNCEPPVGDLTKYRVLLSECENYDPKIKGSRKSNGRKPVKLSMGRPKTPNQKINCLHDQNEKNNCDSMSKSQHKRSRSLPSYECVPLSQQQVFDAAYDEEYHEETYWQDVKTNF